MSQDKRFRYFGCFRGAPSGGKGQFGRGQPSRPIYPAPPPPRRAPVQPYSSAMPKSHRVQTSGQQSTAPRGCYECGDPGHMKRFCPRLRGKVVHQGSQPIITAPVAAPVVRPPRGGGQVGSGRPRGGVQVGGGQSGDTPARF
ncbi:PREDICTED: uncharacterized protein LOC109244169 [Nicotiana attenuata]|uniref:uncharacterized protein LOC109244169 n=1 Tax=Nicotiana attenuata TaxID=49451 RepID=UPI0009057C13|nr:PREDICTED: uncharacterized protein LOC109244169 [Nicotiana attenuata]